MPTQAKFYVAEIGGQSILVRAKTVVGARSALARVMTSAAKLRLATQEELLTAGRADARIIDATRKPEPEPEPDATAAGDEVQAGATQ